MKKLTSTLVGAMAFATCAQAQVIAEGAWIRATVAQQTATGAFMALTSARDARLVAVQSPLAGSGEIHQMDMQGQMMRMREVGSLDLPSGKRVNLATGSYHIMLIGLKRQLKVGERVPVSLTVQGKDGKRETLWLKVVVKPIGYVPT